LSFYGAGLIGHVPKGAKASGLPASPDDSDACAGEVARVPPGQLEGAEMRGWRPGYDQA